MKESLNGWALQENSKVDSLEQEREELRRSNSILTAELSKVTTARNAAEADVELVRSELRTTRALLEHSEGEVSRLKEGGEQAREHIATLHTSLSKVKILQPPFKLMKLVTTLPKTTKLCYIREHTHESTGAEQNRQPLHSIEDVLLGTTLAMK
jgi:chromosome segregation ATPase